MPCLYLFEMILINSCDSCEMPLDAAQVKETAHVEQVKRMPLYLRCAHYL